jgi:hypothetical protein
VVDDPDSSADESAVEEEGIATDAAAVVDEGRAAHDAIVIKTTRDQAIYDMRQIDVVIDAEEEKMALQIFPRVRLYYCDPVYFTYNMQVAGLARRVHDNSTLKEKFDTLVHNDHELTGDKTTLDRRFPTWWNADLTCLDAHLHFRNPVEQLTGAAINKLRAYHLSEPQWDMATTLSAILEVLAIYHYNYLVNLFYSFSGL